MPLGHIDSNSGSSGSGSATPGGLDTDVQYNDSGVLGGDNYLKHNKTTGTTTFNSNTYTIGDLGGASFVDYIFSTGTIPLNLTSHDYQITAYLDVSLVGRVYSVNPVLINVPGIDVQGVGSAVINYGETGYTADGTTWIFQIYPIYGSYTSNLYGSTSVTDDTSSNPYGIDFTITDPGYTTGLTGYYIYRVNDGAAQIVTTSFIDDNTGWNMSGTPSTLITGYSNSFSITPASGATGYKIVNSTLGYGIIDTPSDPGSGVENTIITPSSIQASAIISNGPEAFNGDLQHSGSALGFYGKPAITQPNGDIKTALDNLGLISGPTLSLNAGYLQGTLGIANGGTNTTSFTNWAVINYVAANGFLTSSSSVFIRPKADTSGALSINTGGSVPNTTLQINGDLGVVLGGSQSVSSPFGDFYAVNSSYLDLIGTGNTISGFDGVGSGKILFLNNRCSGNITLTHQGTSSTAANRIITPTGASMTIPSGGIGQLIYDSTVSRWRIVSLGNIPIALLTGTGTGVNTFLTTPSSANLATAVTDETGSGALVFATSPTLVTPLLGTPTSGVATNLTGTASGLTAGNVTTNANLTGDVTSVGNATTLTNAPVIAKVLTGYSSSGGTISATDSILQAIQKLNGNDATNANLTGPITSSGNTTAIAAQTGTGTTFVVDTSPTLVTPNVGIANGTSIKVGTSTNSAITIGSNSNVILGAVGIAGQTVFVAATNGAQSTGNGAGIIGLQDDGTAILSGNRLAFYTFGGSKDTSHNTGNGGAVSGYAAGNWSSTSIPTDIVIQTAPSGSTTRADVARFNSAANVGIGTLANTISARLHLISTTEQLRVGYDTSNYYSTTVGSTGGVTYDAVGSGAGFTFSDQITGSSGYVGSDLTASALVLTDSGKKLISGTVANLITAGIPTVTNVALTAQVADIAAANLATVAGSYIVGYSLQDTAADITAGAVVLTISYTDGAGATTATATQVLTGTGRQSGVLYIQLASGNLTYAITHTGLFGTATYALYITTERVR